MSVEVVLETQGNLVRASVVGHSYVPLPTYAGPKRGEVENFSARSRKRLLERIARLEFNPVDGQRHFAVFLTLTMLRFYHPMAAKRFLQAFIKRMIRKYPDACGFWRLEYQERGAVHFHLILFNIPYWPKREVQQAWGEVIGEDRPWTRIESIRNKRGVFYYVSKYAAKQDDSCGFNYVPYLTDEGSQGRVWGVIQADKLPLGKIITYVLDYGSWFHNLKKLAFLHWEGIDLDNEHGFTLFLDDPGEFMSAAVLLAAADKE